MIAARDFCERPSIGCDGVAESLAIDELAFAAAGDEFGLAENLEMVRDSCGGDAAHRDDVATAYLVGCRDSLKDPKTGLVCQGFGYLLDLRTVHAV